MLDSLRDLVSTAPSSGAMALPARLEMELGELSPEDAEEFMQAMGVSGSQLGTVTSEAYTLAQLISFFTAGDDECRAWTIRQGTNAQDAAGEIHSDLARGFIRAEVIRWDQLLEAGSEAAAFPALQEDGGDQHEAVDDEQDEKKREHSGGPS